MKNHSFRSPSCTLLGFAFFCLMCSGVVSPIFAVTVSPLISPNGVMQSGAPIPVWGTASAGQEIEVRLGRETRRARADRTGQWRVDFSALPASQDALHLSVSGDGKLDISPLYVGEVIIAAGGKNWSPRVNEEEPTSKYHTAVFTLPRKTSYVPSDEIQGRWQTKSIKQTTAAFLLASILSEKADGPVGIIVAESDTALESWIPEDLLHQAPEAAPILAYYEKKGLSQKAEAAEQDYKERMAAWIRAGQNLPLEPEDAPRPAAPPKNQSEAPSVCFNGLIAPLQNLPARALVWDHGEDNSSTVRAAQYGHLLPYALAGFRRNFNHPDLPILIVERRSGRNRLYDDRAGADLRESQWSAEKFPLTAVVPTVDLGPKPASLPVAERIASTLVGQLRNDTGVQAPRLVEHRLKDGKFYLRFEHTGGGLQADGSEARGLMMHDDQPPRWVWADAATRGNWMQVSAPGVDNPKSVRYAWQDQPEQGANLSGKNELPVAPFRTDSYRLTTAGTVKPDDFPRDSLLKECYIEDPRLPRVLLIGDSIAIGQIPSMRRLLAGKANVLVGNAFKGSGMYTTRHALEGNTLAEFLDTKGPFDVIQFNMGVHEFASDKNPQAGSKAYAKRLRDVIAVFRKHAPGTPIIWCSSTGTWADGVIDRFPKYLTASRAYNEAAAQVMKEEDIPVSDLFGYTQPNVRKYIGHDKIHLINSVKPEISEFLARNILPRLPNQSLHEPLD